MSGLSYNMLKSLPGRAVEYYHFFFVQFWISDRMTASWKWRWLHIMPKAPVHNPNLTDFRPLMLCEVLQKLMSTNLVHKFLDAIHKHGTLNSVNQAYTREKGVHREKKNITR